MRPSSRLRYLLIVLFGVGFLLSGCMQATDVPGASASIAGTVANPFGLPVAGLSLFLFSPEILANGGGNDQEPLALADEPDYPFTFIGITGIADDGTFELALSEPPAAFLLPIALALANTRLGFEDCVVDVGDSSVMATLLGFEGIALPNIVGLTPMGGALSFALDSDVELDLGDPWSSIGDARVLSWIYADGATTVVTEAASCSSPELVFSADLTLEEGWNQVGFTFVVGVDDAPTVVTLAGAADASVHLTLREGSTFGGQ
jgi:hypothetical protein